MSRKAPVCEGCGEYVWSQTQPPFMCTPCRRKRRTAKIEGRPAREREALIREAEAHWKRVEREERRKMPGFSEEELMEKNPWSEKDVVHKNKKAAGNAKARKLWVKVANKTLENTGDDRLAVIYANVAVKNYFASRKNPHCNPEEEKILCRCGIEEVAKRCDGCNQWVCPHCFNRDLHACVDCVKRHLPPDRPRRNAGPEMGPPKGATVLICTHFAAKGALFGDIHWFALLDGIKFGRPDGTFGNATWAAVCDSCFKKSGGKALKCPLAVDITWERDGFGEGLDPIGGLGVSGNPVKRCGICQGLANISGSGTICSRCAGGGEVDSAKEWEVEFLFVMPNFGSSDDVTPSQCAENMVFSKLKEAGEKVIATEGDYNGTFAAIWAIPKKGMTSTEVNAWAKPILAALKDKCKSDAGKWKLRIGEVF